MLHKVWEKAHTRQCQENVIAPDDCCVAGKDQQRRGADCNFNAQDRASVLAAKNRDQLVGVNGGLVIPTVSTTSRRASRIVRLRGGFITGASCEMLSSPEKARNDPANPVSSVKIVRGLPENMAAVG